MPVVENADFAREGRFRQGYIMGFEEFKGTFEIIQFDIFISQM